MRSLARRLALTLIGLMVVSVSSLLAQEASIVGSVRDSSGGVLPGVTVEAASPALIEKVRTTITDGSGQYRITNLVPGTYSVTFSLTGFATLKQESIQVNTEITVTVNAELKVGALEETLTVVSAASVVDVQNVAARTVMTREVMDVIPQGRNIQAIGIMIPGTALQVGGGGALSRDVGGSGSLRSRRWRIAARGRRSRPSRACASTICADRVSTAATTGMTGCSRRSATRPVRIPPRWGRAAFAST